MSFLGLLRALTILCAVTIGIASATPAAAQSKLAGQAVTVCVARATSHMTPAALFRAPAAFDCDAVQTSLGGGDYWVLSAPVRLSGTREVRSASLWQRSVTLYALYADGTVLHQTLDGRGITRHIALGAIVAQTLPARPAPLVRLLWRVEGAANVRGILVGPRIATPKEAMQANLEMGALYAAFAGLSVALLVYNFALWVALRHRFQLVYCAMTLSLLLYAFSASGALAWVCPDIANNDRLRISYLTLGMSAIAALAFARAFFEPRVFKGRLGRLCNVVGGTMLAAALAVALFAPWQIMVLDRFYTFSFVGLMVVVFPILWRAWIMRSNYLWLFAIAWATPLAMTAARVASAFSMLGYNFWVDNSTLLSMTIEALLSSLAIAYRMRLLSRERDDARASEIAARLLADTDPLTGLLNRRAFLHRAIGRQGEQTLMIADLDHFKQVNEAIGHDGGDEVLRVLARTLRQAGGPDTLVARIGGEEFAILTPTAAALRPDDILAGLRSQRMPYDVIVTASIGICSGPLVNESDWKLLYSSADRALFEAKTAGRDRVRARLLCERRAA